ncbi:RBBP9/YdeN family alpha/beta hydrolase [Bordetella avium]|uniref:RBBP9/YdeN family alpha/beta hydrolase n=11 Tax=Bordetella avium TaxID=521 RepID=UPI000E0C7A9C|nr:alpha/beta hydrolase [Bordetella avium]RIQ12863.1 alpha/beta hydrolase [Bordetella avium]RIQ38124.1 alpha/beta hydrolase [Bordetella avium]RIQ39233.1 alpha/beta hydrolase [Bordetella avium]RIQ43652.1 alpha/beta hydrolase [Bordetella avium]RIQ48827.1 alpha/beta hydrolase [Bordetella avium]
MRLQPIIIPGWKDSGPGHWQTLWADSLPHARRLSQRDWQNPDRNAWIAALSTAVNEATAPVMLIAHSLGCLVAAALPPALHPRVAGALLVAPADVERPDVPDCLRDFAPVPRQPLPFQSVVVASDNDAYCSLVRAQAFAQDWGSRFVILSEAGHINAESGLGNWPQGLKILGALRRRSVWRVSPPIQRVPPVPALSDSLRPA